MEYEGNKHNSKLRMEMLEMIKNYSSFDKSLLRQMRECGFTVVETDLDEPNKRNVIVNGRYKFNLTTSWFTDLETGEKDRSLSNLKSKLDC